MFLRGGGSSFLCALVFGAPALATSFAERPFPNVVYDAKGIVRGKVVSSHADWATGGDGIKRIYTFYEIQPTEIFKHEGGMPVNPSRTIVVRELGGEKDSVGMQVAGAAQFEKGEDAVVFTGPQNLDGSFDVRGLSTGKFNVERDRDGNEYLTGGSLALGQGAGGGHSHSDTSGAAPVQNTGSWSLQSLRELVREQQSSPPAPEKSADNSKPSPGSAAPPQAANAQPPSSVKSVAPVLHNQNPQGVPTEAPLASDSAPPSPLRPSIKWMIGALLGGASYWWVMRRRRR